MTLALLASQIWAQGITTAAMSGAILGQDGAPVAGVAITAVHEPSGSTYSTVSRANGRYDLSNLRVGGPYVVTAAKDGADKGVVRDIYVELGSTQAVNVTLGADVMLMAELNVTGSTDTTFGAGRMGAGTDLSAENLEVAPSVRRSFQDVARLDTRLFLGSLDQGGQLSAQGQNFRYNSFLIDGVQANDSFGLNSNGVASLGSPVPLEALQALTVELNPYSVDRAGFTGALLNAVTKSGTNVYSGMAYYEFANQNIRAANPQTNVKDKFDERTWGMNIGGPVIKDKLFFFLSYDDFKRSTVPPDQNFLPVEQAKTDILARATALNYEAGNFEASSEKTKVNWIAKIDWNISSAHKLSLTYQKDDGTEPTFPSFNSNTTTSFSNYWYDQPRVNESYVARLFSQWTPDLTTEFTYSVADYDGSPANRGSPFPEVQINGVSGVRRDTGASITNGQVRLGTEFSRQLNEIYTTTRNLAGNAKYSLGNHNILVGFDYEGREVTNKFVQAFLGSYTFANVAAWQAGTASSLQRAILAPGATIDDAVARFDIGNLGLFLQDTWRVTDRLTVSGGLRYDRQMMPDAPKEIPNAGTYSEALFQSRFGRPSTSNPDGEYVIAPRFGFTWDLSKDKRRQLRGGAGMFQGRNPLVWLSNAYSNRGVVARQSQSNVTFNPNVTPGTGVGGIPVINVTAEDFKQPVVYKGNLAYDHELPWDGLIGTAEVGWTMAYKMPFTTNLNLKPVGTMPDGRIRYAGNIANTSSGASRSSASATYSSASMYLVPQFADVYLLRNTGEGGGYDFTLKATRPQKNGWEYSVAWTWSRYTETGPQTSSVAQSNYNNRTVFNPNENVGSVSNYNIDHKLVSVLSRDFRIVGKAKSNITLVYEVAKGRPYSWVFSGDANGDGFSDNDLFYVPNGPSDPKVRFSDSAQQTAFWDFVNRTSLKKYQGQVVDRNTERSNWTHTLDLKFTQDLPIYRKLRSQLFVNVINLTNLLNSKWGRLYEVPFSYRRSVAGATYDAVNNQYVYRFDGATLDGVPLVVNETPASRWQITVGMRIKY